MRGAAAGGDDSVVGGIAGGYLRGVKHACVSFLVVVFGACGSDDGGGARDTTAETTADAAAETIGDTADVVEIADDVVDDAASDAPGEVSDAGGDVGSSPEEALEALVAAFCPGYAERWCDNAAGECGCDAAPGFPEPEACKASFRARCRTELGSYLEVVRGGQANYRPEAAASCLEVLGGLLDRCMLMPNDLFFVSCPILSPPGGWGELLPGSGEPCEGPCASGYRCGSDGICRVPGAASASCEDLRDCAAELVCAASDGGASSCRAPELDATGRACTGPDACDGDTSCMASVRKECVAPEAGQVCRYDDDCIDGEYCVLDGETGSCTPAPGEGLACGNGAVCAAGLACDLESSLCGPLPETGEPCGLGPLGPFLCADGLGCLDGLCGTLPGLGEPCAIGTPGCAPGLGCAFEAEGSFCREPAAEGAECQNDVTCADGLYCEFSENRCRADRAVGEPCANGNECGEGACLPDESFAFRCAERPGLGQACFLDECAEGLRCRTPYEAGACVPTVFCRALTF